MEGIADEMRSLGAGRGERPRERRKGNWSTPQTHARAGRHARLTYSLPRSPIRQERERGERGRQKEKQQRFPFGIRHFAQRAQLDNQPTAHMSVRATDQFPFLPFLFLI